MEHTFSFQQEEQEHQKDFCYDECDLCQAIIEVFFGSLVIWKNKLDMELE